MLVIEYVAKFLKDYGITKFFGYQGGAVSKLIKTLIEQGNLEYIQAYHEQGAGFYAEAYARVTGKLAVAVATNGPGVTNFVSSMADAYLDSIPTLFITGQVSTADIKSKKIRQNGFQEIDTSTLTTPVTKYSKNITNPQNIKYELEKAIHIAMSGRKGSVLLSIPVDIQLMNVDESKLKSYKIKDKSSKIKASKLNKVLDLLKSAKRPLIIAGGGIRLSDAVSEFDKFIEQSKIPFVTTLMGFDLYSKFNCGFCGLYGKTASNLAIYNADVVVILGARLAKRQIGINKEKYNKNAKFIHVDIDKNELGHIIKPYLGLNSSIFDFLSEINELIKLKNFVFPDYSGWIGKIEDWHNKNKNNVYLNNSDSEPVKFIEEVSKYIPENSIITADVGQNQMILSQGFVLKKNQRILHSGGLGCMGFSLPASIGAKFASPNSTIVAFSGDGGFQMNIQELQQISARRLPIKCFIFNNNSLGMIQELQKKFLGETFYGTKIGYSVPDLEKIAIAYNLEYFKITEFEDIMSLKEIFLNDKPYLIDYRITENPTMLLNKHCEAEKFSS